MKGSASASGRPDTADRRDRLRWLGGGPGAGGAGHRLRLLVRPTSDRRNLAEVDAELALGDLTDAASLARAAAGCRYVFNVAADYRFWVPDPDAMLRANVDGTLAVMRAAQAAGVERIVHCSSVAALGWTQDGSPADETTPTNEADFIGTYKRSKFLAERAVMDLVRQEGLPAVVVNPAAPVGPRDIKPTPTGKMIRDAAAGRVPAYIDTGLNIVHVDDVAEGHALALERGRIGERYVLGGENLLLKDMLALVAEVVGRRPPRIELPEALVWPAAWFMEGLARLTGIPADDDARPPQDGAPQDVLFLGQGDARTGLRAASGARGDRGRGRLVPRQWHAAAMTTLAVLSLLIWLYLLLAHGRFWQSGPELAPARPVTAPPVAVVVPARDEASLIGLSLRSLLAQEYPGHCASFWSMTAAATALARLRVRLSGSLLSAERHDRPAGAASCGRWHRGWRKPRLRISCC